MALPSTNAFIGLDADTLAQLKAAYTQGIIDIATTGQEYTIVGSRTFRAAELPMMQDALLAINQAIALLPGGNSNPRYATARIH